MARWGSSRAILYDAPGVLYCAPGVCLPTFSLLLTMATNWEITGFPSLLDSLTHEGSRDEAMRGVLPVPETITAGQAVNELIRAVADPLCIAVDTQTRRLIATTDSTTRAAMLAAFLGGVPLELAPDSGERAPTWSRISRHSAFPAGLEAPVVDAVKPARSVGAVVNLMLTRIKDPGYFGFALIDQTTGRVWFHAIDGDPAPISAALAAVPVNPGTMGIAWHEPQRLAFT